MTPHGSQHVGRSRAAGVTPGAALRLGVALTGAAVLSAFAYASPLDSARSRDGATQDGTGDRFSGRFSLRQNETVERMVTVEGLESVSGRTTIRFSAEGTIPLSVSADDAANGYFNTFTGEGDVQVSLFRRDEGILAFPNGLSFTQITEMTGSGQAEGDADLFLDPGARVYSTSFQPYPVDVEVREWTEFPPEAEAEMRTLCDSGLMPIACMVLQMTEVTVTRRTESTPAGYVDEMSLPSSGSLGGTETMDGGTVFTWSIAACGGDQVTLEIEADGWDALTFDEDTEAVALHLGTALTNGDARSVLWTFPPIPGVEMVTDPENGMDEHVLVTYTNLPEENSDFEVEEPVRVRLPGCSGDATAEMPVRFFFDVKGTLNPDREEVPNWFYYWLQTAAGYGLGRGQVAYSTPDKCREISPGKLFGYYYNGGGQVYLCDPSWGSGWNKVTGLLTDGIDTYATTLRHEWAHKEHYEQWWQARDRAWSDRTGLALGDTAAHNRFREPYDLDHDDIPDALERSLGMNEFWYDTHRCKMSDEHYLAWLVEGLWDIGEADEEDWAAPGKQYGPDPAAPPPRPGNLCGIAEQGAPRR